MSVQGLNKLEVWRRAKGFALRVYHDVLPLLPAEEKYGLNQQLRRSASSVPANIAEGHGRFYYKDNVRFCYNARGSLDETLSHIVLCCDLGFIPQEIYKPLEQEGEEISKMLNGYISFLKKSKQGEHEPGAEYMVHDEIEPYITDIEKDATSR